MSSLKKIILSVFVLVLMTSIVHAQQKNALQVGDLAPAIKYSKWIKGEPVDAYDADHIYILEFWATWCKPCRAAMPHLSELQKQYTGKVTVIGVNILESSDFKKTYDTNLPKIEAFVKSNAVNMDFSVIADNNEEYMRKNWFEAAGLYGIPATFIVKNKRIIWIGEPDKLDSTLATIFNGTYDMEAATTSLENEQAEFAAYNKAVETVGEAFEKGSKEEAFRLIEKVKADLPNYAIRMSFMKFIWLISNVGEKEAIEYGKEWQKENKEAANYMLNLVGSEDSHSKDTYIWTVDNFLKSGLSTNPVVLIRLAFCNAKTGNYKDAIRYQEEAIAAANEANAKGDTANTISEEELKNYVKTLSEYKKLAR